MSKSRSSRRRDTFDIANRWRLPLSSPYLGSPFLYPSTSSFLTDDFRLYEDRRHFHPEGVFRSARSFQTPFHRLTLVPDRFARLRSFPAQTKAAVAFKSPERVLVCVRRKIRREVMHAYGISGSRGQRRPRYNWMSRVSCRG